MGLMRRMAAAVGLGRCGVTVGVADAQHFRGGAVRGSVLLEGGDAEQTVGKVTTALNEFWVEGSGRNRSQRSRCHAQQVLAEGVLVAPGFRQEYPFQLDLPSDARCSRRREGWTILAEAHIAWAVDARGQAVLKVVPHPEVLALQRAAKGALGLVPISWDGSRARVFYDFAAPPWLQSQLDGVAFRVEVIGDTVTGEMVLNRQERGSVTDLLKAAVGADRESIPLTIPRSVLVTKRGSPNPEGAYPYLKDLFERAGVAVPGR